MLCNHLLHGGIDSFRINRESVRLELHLLLQCECRGTRVNPPVQINAVFGAEWVTLTVAGVFLGLARTQAQSIVMAKGRNELDHSHLAIVASQMSIYCILWALDLHTVAVF